MQQSPQSTLCRPVAWRTPAARRWRGGWDQAERPSQTQCGEPMMEILCTQDASREKAILECETRTRRRPAKTACETVRHTLLMPLERCCWLQLQKRSMLATCAPAESDRLRHAECGLQQRSRCEAS